MDKFANKLAVDFATNQRIALLIGLIDEFKGKWNFAEKREPRYLKELREIAAIESAGASTRLEGATLTNREVQQIVNEKEIPEGSPQNQQRLFGYYEALLSICSDYSKIKLSETSLKQLHQLLLKHSAKDERHRGGYKYLPNNVVLKYSPDEPQTVFSATEPASVEGEMRKLIEWANFRLAEKDMHPLIVFALFVFEFIAINPFHDGNGLLSRLLTTLFLLQQGYEFLQYISFENHIEHRKKEYYEALMCGLKNRNTDEECIDKWLIFFLDSLKLLTEKLEQKHKVFKSKGGYLNKRQKQIRDFIVQNQPLKVGDLSDQFPKISIATLKKDLQYLRNEQILLMIGKGKGCVYILKEFD